MPQIRPISDLRNNFADISKFVHESQEPIFLTKNGYGHMVVMSLKTYESLSGESSFSEMQEGVLAAEKDIENGNVSDAMESLKKIKGKI
ncbi:MAG: type II toxin-antitoxin system Phd/YefM family antitoxin [Clostridia bacterium]